MACLALFYSGAYFLSRHIVPKSVWRPTLHIHHPPHGWGQEHTVHWDMQGQFLCCVDAGMQHGRRGVYESTCKCSPQPGRCETMRMLHVIMHASQTNTPGVHVLVTSAHHADHGAAAFPLHASCHAAMCLDSTCVGTCSS